MIRRSPAENYYKYLVVHPDAYDNGFIRGSATDLGLDYLGDWYIQWLRQRMRPPMPFRPEDVRHHASQKFLIREGLTQVFIPNADMAKAYKILAKPRWRELVETLLISHAPHDAIVHGLRVRYNCSAELEAIRLYKHYFWDVDMLDSTELRALLDMRFTGVLENNSEKEKMVQVAALSRARHSDPRVVAARMPSSPLSSMVAQLQMGVMPRVMPTAEIIEATMNVAGIRALEAVTNGGPNGAQMGQSFSAIVETMLRVKDAVVNPEAGLREDLRKIGVATTPTKVPTLHQLSAGRHTVNVHPDPKGDTIEAEGESVDDDDEIEEDGRDPADAHIE